MTCIPSIGSVDGTDHTFDHGVSRTQPIDGHLAPSWLRSKHRIPSTCAQGAVAKHGGWRLYSEVARAGLGCVHGMSLERAVTT